eukprot:scaffold82068_cov75-Phaeocystis_antarctica.AAC.5
MVDVMGDGDAAAVTGGAHLANLAHVVVLEHAAGLRIPVVAAVAAAAAAATAASVVAAASCSSRSDCVLSRKAARTRSLVWHRED